MSDAIIGVIRSLPVVRAALLCSVALGALPAVAQETPADASQPANDTEIVVTALKRATNIQETPIAISAVSAAALTNQGITSSQDLTRVAPNLVIRPSSNGGSRMIIRNIYASGEPTVGLYYDETPLTGTGGVSNDAGGTTPEVRLFDVQRAEVLRGPQGTLYGAGSMAGTIRLIFNKPNLSEYEGAAAGEVRNIAHGDWGGNGQAMVNVPVIADKLAIRAVGFYEKTGGWLDNSKLGLTDFNTNRSYGGRLLVRVKPADNLTIDGLAIYQNRRGFSPSWNWQEYKTTGRAYDQSLPIQTVQRDRLQLYSGTLNWDFGFAALTAVGSYSKRDLEFSFDYTPYFQQSRYFTNSASGCKTFFSTGGANCTDTQVAQYRAEVMSWLPIVAYQPQSTKTSTEEVRLANADHALKWTVGVYHSVRDNFVRSLLYTANSATGLPYQPPQIHLNRTIADKLEQIAGFGELTYDITSTLSLTGGVRYFDYRKTTTTETSMGNPVAGAAIAPLSTLRGSENGTALKFGASYKLTPDVMIYASASQGFRPGGVNQILGFPDSLANYARTYKSDRLWDYEFGIKTAWFDRQLIFNIGLFQIDWKDMQVSANYNNAFSFITNAGQTRVRGVEVESTVFPVEHLSLRASGSYTSARLQGDEVVPGGIVIVGAGKDGDYVPQSPKWTAQGSADYNIPVSDDLQVLTHADINYLGSSWTVFDRSLSPHLYRLPAFTTVGLRVGIERMDSRWGVYFFVNNLFDTIGITGKSSGATIGNIIVNGQTVTDPNAVNVVATQPRTIGLSFRTKF